MNRFAVAFVVGLSATALLSCHGPTEPGTTPTIALSSSSVTFTATVGGSNPAAETVTVTNSGTGTLSDLAIGTITYGAGASGWLAAGVSPTTAPATVTLTPTLGSLAVGSYTAHVPVTSSASGVTDSPQTITVTFTVSQAPTIALSSSSVTFTATVGGSNPAAQTVTVTNSGTGTLSGLAIGTITYDAGASGWLAAGVSPTTAPATVTLTPTLGSLAVGSYTAHVPVTSSASGVTDSPQTVTVTFTVSQAPTIALSSSSVTFTATAGGSSPAVQPVTVTNSGTGTLSGLAIGTITYDAGASGWLAASVSPTTAPATVTLTPTLGSLAVGSYTAHVPVTSSASGVTDSPQTVTVTFTVSQAPTIALSSSSVTFTATAGGSSPAVQPVTVTNSGTGTLSGLAIGTITYDAGASGWLAASVSPTTAPATVTLTPTLGSLAAGSYTAHVPVTSSASGVTDSPQTITVTFTVSQAPTIALSSSSVTFTATVGGSNPAAQTVTVTNSGTGTLSGLAIGTITYDAGASGWLAAGVSPTTAPATVTLTPTLGSLAVGSYTAHVPVTSSASGVTDSPQTVTVTFTVSQAPTIALSSSSVTFTATAGGSSPAVQPVTVTNSGTGTLSGLAIGTITYDAGASGWLAASVSPTTAPATVTLTPTLGTLAASSYTAHVPVTSSASGVTDSPQTITVTFTVAGRPSLGVSLVASPTSGDAPLTVTLTATDTGTATAPFTYSFWWNCTSTDTSVTTVASLCGDPTIAANGAQFVSSSQNPKVVSHSYAAAGTYTPKVIVQHASALTAQALSAQVQVAPTAPSSLTATAVSASQINVSLDQQRGRRARVLSRVLRRNRMHQFLQPPGGLCHELLGLVPERLNPLHVPDPSLWRRQLLHVVQHRLRHHPAEPGGESDGQSDEWGRSTHGHADGDRYRHRDRAVHLQLLVELRQHRYQRHHGDFPLRGPHDRRQRGPIRRQQPEPQGRQPQLRRSRYLYAQGHRPARLRPAGPSPLRSGPSGADGTL